MAKRHLLAVPFLAHSPTTHRLIRLRICMTDFTAGMTGYEADGASNNLSHRPRVHRWCSCTSLDTNQEVTSSLFELACAKTFDLHNIHPARRPISRYVRYQC